MKEKENEAPKTFGAYLKNAEESIGIFRWLFKEMTNEVSKKWIIHLFALTVIIMICQALQPGALSYVFNGVTQHSGNKMVYGLGVFFVCIILQKILERWLYKAREWVLGTYLGNLEEVLTKRFFEKSLAQHAHDSHLLSPATIDKGKWKAFESVKTLLLDGSTTLMQLGLSLICLFWLNWIAGVIMSFVVLAYASFAIYLNSRLSMLFTPIETDFRRINRRRFERWEGVERVKVSGKESVENVEMSTEFNKVIGKDRAFWLSFYNFTFIRSLINAIGLMIIMSWGAWLIWNGKISIGMLYALYAWATRVSENIWRIGDIEHGVNWNLPAVRSMMKGILIEPAITDKPDAVSIDPKKVHRIEFDGVSHTYLAEKDAEEDPPPTLVSISFTIEPGEKVALLGPSGAGKSTIMKTLLRFDDPTSGAVLVDGIDLRNILQSSWKQGIGYIPQHAQVFDGTIKSNLIYSLSPEEQQCISDDDLWKLMKLLQIDFKDRLTAGLDTIVGKDGIKLSGGQAQRLMIGAAVIKNPWLLVIDEATSSLDSTTEKQVQKGLSTILSNTSTSALIVAHRLSTVRHLCSKFVMLRPSGNIPAGESQVEAIAASFEELYEISPTFRQLADDQEIVIHSNLVAV
jgi:ABC-type multidrug transport system fused ATPase/permease subunit